MFNALDKYDSALTRLNESTSPDIPQEVRKDFELTIDKCWKLINIYGEDSNYADDALLLIAKSNFHLQEYTKSERFARQMIQKYPESDLYEEGNLWLAKSLIKLNQDDEAISFLNTLIASEANDDLKSRAWFSLGDLYYERGQFPQAIDELRTCIEYAEDELLVSEAQYLIGRIYFENGDYEQAADELDVLFDYDEPIGTIYESQMLRVNTLLKLDDPDEALYLLNMMSRETRFFKYQDRIQARIGECLAYDGETEQAIGQYEYTMRNHPRTPGSGIAAFGLAEILEHTYAEYDSARKLYLRVKQEDRNSDLNIKAGPRAYVLEQYLKIRDNINADLQELNADSLELDEEEEAAPDTTTESLPFTGVPADTGQIVPVAQQPKPAGRPAKRRTPEEIGQSLMKNRFALAEFFLLTMQNYDSAAVAYNRFIETYQDSTLVPKAYYALYYLYDFELQEQAKADSIQRIILDLFPDSPYAMHFIRQKRKESAPDSALTDSARVRYLRAEKLMFEEDYADALPVFRNIAQNDTGTAWAEKAQYAIAWIYEKKLEEIDSALAAYQYIAETYPNSTYGKIAQLKIQPPPPEPEPDSTMADSGSAGLDSTTFMSDTTTVADSTADKVDPEALKQLEKIDREEPGLTPEPMPGDSSRTLE
jgi:tetratricopeptide (TPR) repeat protein